MIKPTHDEISVPTYWTTSWVQRIPGGSIYEKASDKRSTDYQLYLCLLFSSVLFCWYNTEGHALVQEGRSWYIYQGWLPHSPLLCCTHCWYPCLSHHTQWGRAWAILWYQKGLQQPSPTIIFLDQQGIASVRDGVNCYGSDMADCWKLRVCSLLSTLYGANKKPWTRDIIAYQHIRKETSRRPIQCCPWYMTPWEPC